MAEESNTPPVVQAQPTAETPSHMERETGPASGNTAGNDRKRKRFEDHKGRFGSRGKRGDLGRRDHQRMGLDKRERNNAENEKREQTKPLRSYEDGEGRQQRQYGLVAEFDKEAIAAEDRRPKRKVAVLIGYSGTGYRGMQISPSEKTIEGDLFKAFVEAGAISKANANDPKKSSLVRCARTDKGVHAAGNMISLKLIVEDEDIVDRINAALDPQIRVWGIERTIGSFSCYQQCDSRWYEYLIPTNALLPPHPSSYLARKIADYAKEVGDEDKIAERQADVEGFWEKVEEADIKPVLAAMDEDIRELVLEAIYPEHDKAMTADARENDFVRGLADMGSASGKNAKKQKRDRDTAEEDEVAADEPEAPIESATDESESAKLTPEQREKFTAAVKQMKKTYEAARRAYRVSDHRVQLLQSALSAYLGTRNFHNYTIEKTANDPSAKRVIKSFVADPTPIIINGTEWLSLKVHGQSFMMHQIRKMVGMATLLIRCGADAPLRISQSYGKERWSIPKVPGLGLLLERPVFDSYNKFQAQKFGKEELHFGKYEEKIEGFKRDHIYARIWEEEAASNVFHQFFNHIDNFQQPYFLYLTSKGYEATQVEAPQIEKEKVETDKADTATLET